MLFKTIMWPPDVYLVCSLKFEHLTTGLHLHFTFIEACNINPRSTVKSINHVIKMESGSEIHMPTNAILPCVVYKDYFIKKD